MVSFVGSFFATVIYGKNFEFTYTSLNIFVVVITFIKYEVCLNNVTGHTLAVKQTMFFNPKLMVFIKIKVKKNLAQKLKKFSFSYTLSIIIS